MLLEAGVRPERVTAVGSGELRPIASNETQDGRARNRRVEIVLNGFASPVEPTEPARAPA